ncbi:carbohydrate ABC transporter permease [Paenibacillus faecalis]|uniref:carbohydrate ABC transporter permease n=1 Tax=Paenibacillus faecalis TaxID=2079532 RepID=UPI000D0E8EAE|nr:carbohydrate ABC transporter permease [Paenibacillus faecalis]
MNENTGRNFASNLLTRIVLLIYSLIVLYPLFWTLMTSFKTTTEFYDNPWSLPSSLSWENYINALDKANLGAYFFNSILVTAIALVVCNGLSFAAAYVIARFQFPFRKWLQKLYMGSLFIPVAFSIIPLFILLNNMNLLDSLIGLSLAYAASAIPFTIYLLIGFLITIPKEYEEAAAIDGCSNFKTMIQVILPMAKSGMITITIFNFMAFWNEYVMALSFITTETKRTLTLGLAYLMEIQRFSTDWGALFAGLVLVMLPTMLMYALLQRKITAGLNMGGIKG